MKYYKDYEGYVWKEEDGDLYILDDMLGWDRWDEYDGDDEPVDTVDIIYKYGLNELTKDEAFLEMV
jgi:hypothetical protein